jgi:hypothetical protein
MPTPSHDAPDPLSPPPSSSSRLHPFSSCPDPEASQDATQPTLDSTTSPEPPSPSQASEPSAHHSSRNAAGDSRSVTMSPGPQLEDGMTTTPRADAGDRHKPADVEDETGMERGANPVRRVDVTGSGGVSGLVAGDGADRTNQTGLSGPPGRRKSNSAQQQLLPTTPGQVEEVDAWTPFWRGPRWVEDSGLVGLGPEYSHMRVLTPAPSLYLQPGSRFSGTQQSERQRYDVDVELKHVDLRESFLCGYLRIQGASTPASLPPSHQRLSQPLTN